MWAIHSCDLISDSVCVVNTMILKKQVGSDKNKHDIFGVCLEQGSQGHFVLSQK